VGIYQEHWLRGGICAWITLRTKFKSLLDIPEISFFFLLFLWLFQKFLPLLTYQTATNACPAIHAIQLSCLKTFANISTIGKNIHFCKNIHCCKNIKFFQKKINCSMISNIYVLTMSWASQIQFYLPLIMTLPALLPSFLALAHLPVSCFLYFFLRRIWSTNYSGLVSASKSIFLFLYLICLIRSVSGPCRSVQKCLFKWCRLPLQLLLLTLFFWNLPCLGIYRHPI
jgi:hypothetical protein